MERIHITKRVQSCKKTNSKKLSINYDHSSKLNNNSSFQQTRLNKEKSHINYLDNVLDKKYPEEIKEEFKESITVSLINSNSSKHISKVI